VTLAVPSHDCQVTDEAWTDNPRADRSQPFFRPPMVVLRGWMAAVLSRFSGTAWVMTAASTAHDSSPPPSRQAREDADGLA